MSKALAEREANIAKFQAAFNGESAPELTNSLTWKHPETGKKEIPYKLIKLGKDSDYGDVKAVFEAEDRDSGTRVQVDYNQTYGLKLRRTLHQLGNTLIYGEVTYNSDGLQICIGAGYFAPMLLHPLCVKDQLADMQSMRAGISVTTNNPVSRVPRLASMEYETNSQIPLYAEFPLADLEDAKAGTYETRKGRFDTEPTYLTTYFQWENLVGAKVGATRFKEPADSTNTFLRSYANATKINNSGWTEVPDSHFVAKISHSRDRRQWGSGRLRFSRKNTESGETWIFSVPEWITKKGLIDNLQRQSLTDFSYSYPVIFCIKRPDQPREWLSNWGRIDRAR